MTVKTFLKNTLVIVLFILVLGAPGAVGGQIIYVDKNSPGSNNGQDWTNAYRFLQDALTAANSGDEIRVADGIYRPDEDTAHPYGTGDRTATFFLKNGVAIYGGFQGYIYTPPPPPPMSLSNAQGATDWEATAPLGISVATSTSLDESDPNARDLELYETILSGDLSENDIEVDPCDLLTEPTRTENSYTVIGSSDTNESSILDGFTITGGNANNIDAGYFRGGGMYNGGGKPTISNCTFTRNSAYFGGGLHNFDSSPTLIYCTLNENSAKRGGGINNERHSSPMLINCTFTKNCASGRYSNGGGIFNGDCSNPTIVNCIFTGNSTDICGGGMYNVSYSRATLTNCTFANNSAVNYGGAIYWDYVTLPPPNPACNTRWLIITNCILRSNSDSSGSGESAQIHSVLTPTANYNCIQGWTGALGGTGNIDADPCFADANNGDYHIRADSPCINAGDPNYVAAPNEVDLDGRERVFGGRIDMGAYEYHVPTIYVDVNAPGPTHDGSSWTNAYNYLQDALADAGSAPKPVEIRVAQGIYKPDQTSADPNGSGNRYATFQLINGVTLKGGYAGFGESEPNERDVSTYETILSGDLNGDDLPIHPYNVDDNSYRVVTGSSTETNAVLDGLTISDGMATGMYNYGGSPALANCTFTDNIGGGMYNTHFSNPVVTNCNFYSNLAGENGGAMYNQNSNPVVTGCTFVANSAMRFGGAVYNEECSPTFDNCTFRENLSENGGGGMYNNKSSPTLINCTFEGNWSGLFGGGLDTAGSSSSPTVIGCTFIGNSADFRGGGTSNGTSSLTLINCIFINNSAMDEGGAMNSCNGMNISVSNCTFYGNQAPNGNLLVCSCSPFNVQFTNCIIWDGGNEIWNPRGSIITLTYSNVYGGRMSAYDPCESLIWGEGNIDTDPCFADANNGDYHLKSQAGRWDPNSESWVKDDVTSPCIDAGNPGCPEANEPAPNGNRINMGAYGGTAEASKSPTYWRSIADMTNDWIVDSNDLKVFVSYWLQTGECIPGDLDRSRSIDSNDFALFAGQWRQIGPGPGITYKVDECIPIEPILSTAGESEPTRFTVTVEGGNIRFEDLITANCCADEIELLMTIEAGLITIYEIEHTPMPPCPCICDYPTTATLGPFDPGTYILEVYQGAGFIGTTTVTIDPPQ